MRNSGLSTPLIKPRGFTSYIPRTHADLARVVVDLENMNTFGVNDAVLGLSKKLEAHEVDGQSKRDSVDPGRGQSCWITDRRVMKVTVRMVMVVRKEGRV
ncbi:hypothetical protein ACSQ67_001460 [Phaseolus vulgaris]